MEELASWIAWKLGFTVSPSRYIVDGHGYSWIGKKIRGKQDRFIGDAMVAGYEEGVRRAKERA